MAGMSAFVEGTADYFRAQQSALTIWPNASPGELLPITHGISAEEIHALFEQRNRPGTIFASLQNTPIGETIALERQDRPLESTALPDRQSADITVDSVNVLGGVVTADDNNRCHLLLFRDLADGAFSPSDRETLRDLMGYLRRAIELNKRFVKMFVEHRTALTVLDRAPRSVIILGNSGRVTYNNEAGRRLLAEGDGICLQDGVLTITDPRAREEVEAFLEWASSADRAAFDSQRLMIVVPRRADGAAIKLVMYRLPFDPRKASLNPDESLAVALAYDPSIMTELNAGLLNNFYKLTHAESLLAQQLYDGHALPEASMALGISVHTARTQLRSIFKKVGVHSQAALLKELAKSFFNA